MGSIVNAAVGPGASDYRERALRAAGIDPASAEAKGYEVHHIVAEIALAAAPARQALSEAGIGIHDLRNLVALYRGPSKSSHRRVL